MIQRNSVILGVLIGLILPVLTWFIINQAHVNITWFNKPAIPYMIAIGINLLLLRYCHHKGADETSKGIMLVTFACMLALFILKVR